MTFTDYSAFQAALPGNAVTLDFDGLAAGTLIEAGDRVDGITFDYDFGGVSMLVTDVFDTTSARNFLGTDDGHVLLDGDDFGMSFDPMNAIGLFFITADEMFDGDITLTAAMTAVHLSVDDAGAVLPDGGVPYFLGIVDLLTPFTTADVSTTGGGFFLYNVDDITTARTDATPVPEPETLRLLAAGLIVLLAAAYRRKSSTWRARGA